jgi:hypothetical protein
MTNDERKRRERLLTLMREQAQAQEAYQRDVQRLQEHLDRELRGANNTPNKTD